MFNHGPYAGVPISLHQEHDEGYLTQQRVTSSSTTVRRQLEPPDLASGVQGMPA